jgi:hypothetical protein
LSEKREEGGTVKSKSQIHKSICEFAFGEKYNFSVHRLSLLSLAGYHYKDKQGMENSFLFNGFNLLDFTRSPRESPCQE